MPDLIENWTKIVRLDMQGISMDGPIPSTIAQLKDLTELRISDLNGSSMKFPDLQELKMLNTLYWNYLRKHTYVLESMAS